MAWTLAQYARDADLVPVLAAEIAATLAAARRRPAAARRASLPRAGTRPRGVEDDPHRNQSGTPRARPPGGHLNFAHFTAS